MKKILLLTLMVLIFATSAAFATKVKKGDAFLNAGIGLATFYGTGDQVLPPIMVSYEKAVKDKITIGGYLSYYQTEYSYSWFGDGCDWSYNYITIGARGAYHFYDEGKWDAYGGLFLGYNILFFDDNCDLGDYTNDAAGSFGYAFFAGARYWFTPKIGAFAELGYGLAALSIGVTFSM